MKMQKISMLLAALLLAGSVVCADETEGVDAAAPEGSTEAALTPAEGAVLSDKWSDFQIGIDGEVYQFPMMYDDFVAMGWTADDDLTGRELEPNQYDFARFTKDGTEATAYIYILNLGMNTMEVEDCIVAGIDLDSFDWEIGECPVTLPGGIVRGEADREAIEAAYGVPTDVYEGDYDTSLTYETDSYNYIELDVSVETGKLDGVEVRNFVEPEGFEAGEVSTEVPEAVAAYEKPEALGDSLTDFRIEVDGQVYALPVPVSTLIADGWELNADDSDPYIPAGNSGWVTLRNGGQELRTSVENPEPVAVTIENAWITEIALGEYATNLPGSLPGGITTGMQEADFVKILDDAGVTYETDESSDFKYYTYNEESWDRSFSVTVYTGTDSFEQNSIMEIRCNNTFE